MHSPIDVPKWVGRPFEMGGQRKVGYSNNTTSVPIQKWALEGKSLRGTLGMEFSENAKPREHRRNLLREGERGKELQ